MDFLVGKKGDESLKQRLANFFYKVGYGDWTALYKYPAGALLRFMTNVLGPKAFSFRYILRTALLSVSLSTLLFCLAMIWSYIHVILTEKHCPVPGLGQFLEIPSFMKPFLIDMALFNIAFDYVSWTATRWGLKVLLATRGFASLLILLFFPVFGTGLLWLLYALYLPMAISVEAEILGRGQLVAAQMAQIFRANFGNIYRMFTTPHYLFVIGCPERPVGMAPLGQAADHAVFSISFIQTMQIVATETMLPIVLLILACAFGFLIYAMRPVTKRPLELLLDRLEGSPSRLFVTVGTLVGAIGTIIKAIVDYYKATGSPR